MYGPRRYTGLASTLAGVVFFATAFAGCGVFLGLDQYAATTCADGVKGGAESDIDCGGPSCGACTDGKGCRAPGDCASGQCTAGICAKAACSDDIKNGAESDVDCGGG